MTKFFLKSAVLRQKCMPASALKDLCNLCMLTCVDLYNTLIITNVAKRLFKYVPYILL